MYRYRVRFVFKLVLNHEWEVNFCSHKDRRKKRKLVFLTHSTAGSMDFSRITRSDDDDEDGTGSDDD